MIACRAALRERSTHWCSFWSGILVPHPPTTAGIAASRILPSLAMQQTPFGQRLRIGCTTPSESRPPRIRRKFISVAGTIPERFGVIVAVVAVSALQAVRISAATPSGSRDGRGDGVESGVHAVGALRLTHRLLVGAHWRIRAAVRAVPRTMRLGTIVCVCVSKYVPRIITRTPQPCRNALGCRLDQRISSRRSEV